MAARSHGGYSSHILTNFTPIRDIGISILSWTTNRRRALIRCVRRPGRRGDRPIAAWILALQSAEEARALVPPLGDEIEFPGPRRRVEHPELLARDEKNGLRERHDLPRCARGVFLCVSVIPTDCGKAAGLMIALLSRSIACRLIGWRSGRELADGRQVRRWSVGHERRSPHSAVQMTSLGPPAIRALRRVGAVRCPPIDGE